MVNELKKFALWALGEVLRGHDLDCWEVEDNALELGLLKEVKYDPAIHGPSDYDVQPGEPWYVLSDSLK